jgi:rubrerythrin
MPTRENLQAAFAGESQANRMYLAFAKKADRDGFPNTARLFRAAAAAETVHAHAHFRVLGGVKTTEDNLKAAIAGEAHEFQTMYPAFLAEAEAAGEKAAVLSFRYALAVEKIHHDLYAEALAAFTSGQDTTAGDMWVCEVCGHTIRGAAPERCPVCGALHEKYTKVE